MIRFIVFALLFLISAGVNAETQLATDGFDTGSNWTTVGLEGISLVSSQARDIAANSDLSISRYNVTTPGNDQYAQITIANIAGTVELGIGATVRTSTSAFSLYACEANKNASGYTSEIFKYVTGSYTQLATENATTWVNNDTIRCDASGTNVTMRRNGSVLISTSDTSHTSGQGGVVIYVITGGSTPDAQADNFILGDFDWQSIGTLGSTQSKTADQSSLALTTSAACESGNVCVCAVSVDNNGTTDGDEGAVTSITDSASNTWSEIIEFANGQGTAQTGAVAYLGYTKATSTIASSGTITANFSNSTSRDASAMTCWEYSVRSGYTVSSAGTATLATDGADPGAISLSSLTSTEYLFLHGLAGEGPNGDAYTWDTDYTQFSANGTSGAAAPAFDVATESSTFTTTPDPFTFDHGAAGSGVKAAMVFILYNGDSADLVTSVSYGGTGMTRVGIACDSAGEPGCAIAYHLGASVPQGTQTVSINHTATATAKIATAVTMTGGTDTETCGLGTITSGEPQNPQIAVNCTNSAQRYFAIHSGHPNVTDFTLIGGMSAISDHDWGTKVARVDRQTSNSSGSTTVGYTDSAGDDVAMIAFGVSSIDTADSNMHVRGGFRIFVGTGDTVDVTSTTADRDYAQVFAALLASAPTGGAAVRALGLLGVGQ